MHPPNRRAERLESASQIIILLLIGGMAGAVSFTHVHDWTMQHVPAGTGDWFGWTNAVISELTPTAAGLEIRRRRRTGASVVYPMFVLIAAAALSVAAQLDVAKPTPSGWLLNVVPALAFLALTKLALSGSTTTTNTHTTPQRGEPPTEGTRIEIDDLPVVEVTEEHGSVETPALEASTIAAADVPDELVQSARMAAFVHRQQHGQSITATGLADYLGIETGLAAAVLDQLDGSQAGRP